MRETRTAQTSVLDFYAAHEHGEQLKLLSMLLDKHRQILAMVEQDVGESGLASVGRKGLSVESLFRCLLLKQLTGVSYYKLSFLLQDSATYRTFCRFSEGRVPRKSTLQRNVRRVSANTLESIFVVITQAWHEAGQMDLSQLRIDSTVVASDIGPPSDSRLLDDGIRVLSRNMAKSRDQTGIKIRFTDYRKRSKSLAFKIFHAKKAQKEGYYEDHLKLANKVLKQVDRAIDQVERRAHDTPGKAYWLKQVNHYKELMVMVVSQTVRRVMLDEQVPADEKVFSLFEEHTDIIIKGQRDVQYGHKLNLASDRHGIITHAMIEQGNPTDIDRYLPMIEEHKVHYGCCPQTVVADGGYATIENVQGANSAGVARAVFHKKRGLKLADMCIKAKTLDVLKRFRAGIEGNISELKRVFGLDKARWKTLEGFKSYVWASLVCYNLWRMARIRAG